MSLLNHRIVETSVIALMAIVPFVSGCVAEVDPEPAYATVEVDAVPPTIVQSPAVVYEGRPVYYYGDRWYFRRGEHWAYYGREPPALYRQRAYVQSAPMTQTYSAPPAYAPPAERVR
jgi:hypothetical protein